MNAKSALAKRKCIPCEGDVRVMSLDDVRQFLGRIEGWDLVDTVRISKAYRFRDFKDALGFVDRVGEISEAEGHHPDLHLSYGKVIVFLWTHAINGLSENDFILAAKIDHLFEAGKGS